jgi:hypothetical protein
VSALPKDPFILLSYINTQLRDNDCSLEELCQSLDIDMSSVVSELSGIGYTYQEEQNCFRP